MQKLYKTPAYRTFFKALVLIFCMILTCGTYAQFTCGLVSSQEGAVAGGVCVACSISNPGAAADSDTTTFSTVNKTIGAAGYYGQLLRFPVTYQPGDSVSIILEVPGQLLSANVLSGIRVESYNGVTRNNDAVVLTPQLASLQLLGGAGNRYRVTFAVSRAFDGLSVSIADGVSLFNSLRIYAVRAFVAPPVIASSATIHASAETGPVYTGICALCQLTNADAAVDADTTTYATLTASVGAIGYVGQLLRFAGSYAAGDSIRLILSLPGGLADVQALGGVRIETYSGNTPNGNPVFLANIARITLLGGSGKFAAVFAANHSFNGVSVSINGVASALTSLRIYDASLIFTSQGSYQVCEGSSVLLRAALPTGAVINWYTQPTGGTPVASGSSYTTPPLSGTQTYYAEAGRGGCIQPVRTRITISASLVPPAATATPAAQTACSGDTFRIVASSPQASVYNWFTQPSGGSSIFTGDTLSLVANQTATYYIETTANGCNASARTAALVNVSSSPSGITVTPPAATIPSGGNATFTASSTDASAAYRWYAQPSGGTALSTGAQFTTPALTSSTNYYLAVASAAGCQSITRTQVPVTVSAAANNIPCDAATAQTTDVNGICIGCTVSSPALAVDSDTSTASSLIITAGLLNAYAAQTLIMPFTGSAGDTVRIGLRFNNPIADVGVLAGVSVASYNGSTFNNDRTILSGSLLTVRLLNGGVDAVVSFVPQSPFDRVELRLSSGAGSILTQAGIRYVSVIKPIATVSPAVPVVCAGQTATLSATGTSGSSFRWYDAVSGGNLLSAGAVFTTPALTATTTYYISTVSATGCENGMRLPVTVTVNAAPGAPSVTNANVNTCSGGVASASVQAPDAQLTYRWYSAAAGGTAIATGANFLSGALTTDTAFYVEAVSSGGCVSSSRTKVIVHVSAVPAAPQAVNNSSVVCEGSVATLSIQNPAQGIIYNWYATASGGTSLATGTSYATPALNSSATYYAEASASGCTSPRTAVGVTVSPRPALPTVTVTPPSATIQAGATATIQVNSPAAGVTYNWYSNASGGSPVATGNSYTTPSLSASTVFYVEAISAASCASAGRTAVPITVQTVTNLDCDAAVTTSSSVNGACIGCSVSNSTLATDADTTTFSRLNMTVAVLGAEIAQTLVFAQPGQAGDSITLSFGLPPALVSADVLGAIQVETANGLTTNNDALQLNQTAIRLLFAGNRFAIRYAPGAIFDRVTVRLNSGLVAALSSLDIYYATMQVTAPTPVTNTVTVCAGATAMLSVQARTGVTVNWYAAPAGGASLGTGNSFTTPAVNASTVYYAEASRTSNGCVHPVRVPVQVIVAIAPATPTLVDDNVSVCAGSTAIFNVQNAQPGITYRWYDAAAGGNLLFTGNSYTTGALLATTQLYVAAVNATGCESASRRTATATVTSLPAAPLAQSATVCRNTAAVFTVSNAVLGGTYNWYLGASGGSPVFTGNVLTTAPLNADATYYIEAVNSSCVNAGGRTAVTAAIVEHPAPPAVIASASSICNGGTAILTVQNPAPGLSYQWFTTATGGSAVFSGTSYSTPPVTGSVIYYAETVATGGCSSTARTAVSLTAAGSPSAPIAAAANNTSVCGGFTTSLSVQPAGGGVMYEWYDAATGGTRLFTGEVFLTPAIFGAVTYYVQAVTPEGCISPRTAIAITVNTTPAIPMVSPSSTAVVSGSAASFQISNPEPGVVYRWFDAATGGILLASGTAYQTGPLTNNDTIYVEAVNSNQCTYPVRQPVFIFVVQTPQPPQVDGPAGPICSGSAATLSIRNPQPGVVYNWYDAATGGSLLYSGTTITTGALSAGTSYYVEAVAGSVSSARTQITVTVTASPQPPQVGQASVTACEGTTTALSVLSPSTSLVYTWYDAGSGGNLLGTGSNFVTPVINAPASYFVQASSGSCISAVRTRVDVIPASRPAAPGVQNLSLTVCEGSDALLRIASPAAGNNYRWYDAPTGGALIGTGDSLMVSNIVAQRTIYAEAVTAGGCSSSTRTPVMIVVAGKPAAPVVNVPASPLCAKSLMNLTVSDPEGTLSYAWYVSATALIPLFTGASINLSPAGDMELYVEGRNALGCVSPRTRVSIDVLEPLPVPAVSAGAATVSSVTFTWQPVPGAAGYEVSLNNGESFIPVSGTSYTVTGLRPADTVSIWVRSVGAVSCQVSTAPARMMATTHNPLGDEVFVPNGFTPNGDGNNDYFRAYGNTIAKAEIWVYSQWGALLFRSEDGIKGWDGRAGGQLQPSGVYVYFMRITLRSGAIVNKKGSVNLIR